VPWCIILNTQHWVGVLYSDHCITTICVCLHVLLVLRRALLRCLLHHALPLAFPACHATYLYATRFHAAPRCGAYAPRTLLYRFRVRCARRRAPRRAGCLTPPALLPCGTICCHRQHCWARLCYLPPQQPLPCTRCRCTRRRCWRAPLHCLIPTLLLLHTRYIKRKKKKLHTVIVYC